MNFSFPLKYPGQINLSGLVLLAALLNPFLINLAHAEEALDRIVAIINNDVVLLSEMEEKIRTIVSQLREANQQIPPTSALEKQVLDRIILNKLQLQMAERTGIRVDDETLNRSISNIATENGLPLKEFRVILENDGYSFESFRENMRNEIAISRLRQRQIINRISVTDREIDNFLATQEHQGLTETEYRIGHILIAVTESSSEEEIEQGKLVAEKVLEDLIAGQDFAEMAATVSDGQQAANGGDLGWRTKNKIPSLFSDYIAEMQEGDISELIHSPSGFHIIQFSGLRTGEKSIVRQTLAKHILIRADEITSNKAAEEKLTQLLYRIEQGEKFSTIARSNSEDTLSALDGGSLGWRSPGELVPQFEEAMEALEPGQISEPFKTQFGWHIVQIMERRDHDNTENAKRTRARDIIRQRKIKENEQDWLRGLRDDAYVQYRLTEE